MERAALSSSNCARRDALSSANQSAEDCCTSRIKANVETTPNISELIIHSLEAMFSSTIPSILRGSTLSAWRSFISSCRSSRFARKLWISCSNAWRAASACHAPLARNSRMRTAASSKSGISGNSAFNKSWKPSGWGKAGMTGASRGTQGQSPVGAESNSSPIPNITVCSSTACKNSGGNFVAIATV